MRLAPNRRRWWSDAVARACCRVDFLMAVRGYGRTRDPVHWLSRSGSVSQTLIVAFRPGRRCWQVCCSADPMVLTAAIQTGELRTS